MFKLFKSAYNSMVYIPESCSEKMPVIVFLHGVCERGNQPDLVLRNGLPLYIAKQSAFPFLVICPQCPSTEHWLPPKIKMTLNDFIQEYNCDTNRIYITGLSMGGFGTFAAMYAFPYLFAAAAPICGGGKIEIAEKIKHIPMWVFHGALDSVVPLKRSADVVARLNELGADTRFTVFPNGEHNVWDEVYNNPKLYSWFLSNSLVK